MMGQILQIFSGLNKQLLNNYLAKAVLNSAELPTALCGFSFSLEAC